MRNKLPFGRKNRVPVPDAIRGAGTLDTFGTKGFYGNYFDQLIHESAADYVINTETNVKASTPLGDTYYNSTSAEFQDKNDATVTIVNGDKILWAGLDVITANIDISTIDDLTHEMMQGVTIALGAYDLSLGENQRGELNYSTTTGSVSILSGNINLNDSSGKYSDFTTKDLAIDVQSNTTVGVDAGNINFINSDGRSFIVENISEVFDITANLMSGTSEKSSTLYRIWLDSELNKLLVPDLTGTTDSTTANKLEDSTADFVTDKVQIGDIVYNLTDQTQTTVTAIDDLNTLSLADDYFVSGENYKIRMLSPVGLGGYRAMLGNAYNNASSNLDNSHYTQIQERKYYNGDGTDFVITGTPAVSNVVRGVCGVYQENDWTMDGRWKISGNIVVDVTSAVRSNDNINLSGVTFKNVSGFSQPISARTDAVVNFQFASIIENTGSMQFNHAGATTARYYYSFEAELEKKPTFHI